MESEGEIAFGCFSSNHWNRHSTSPPQAKLEKKSAMRPPEGLCSRFPKKISKIALIPYFVLTVRLKEMPNCSPDSTLIPSSLENSALVSINKHGNFSSSFLRSSSPCLAWLPRPFCCVIEVQPARTTCKYPRHVITIYKLTV